MKKYRTRCSAYMAAGKCDRGFVQRKCQRTCGMNGDEGDLSSWSKPYFGPDFKLYKSRCEHTKAMKQCNSCIAKKYCGTTCCGESNSPSYVSISEQSGLFSALSAIDSAKMGASSDQQSWGEEGRWFWGPVQGSKSKSVRLYKAAYECPYFPFGMVTGCSRFPGYQDCGGHGTCSLGKCKCHSGYANLNGRPCRDKCWGKQHVQKACYGHGVCSSGSCRCNKHYSGPHCGSFNAKSARNEVEDMGCEVENNFVGNTIYRGPAINAAKLSGVSMKKCCAKCTSTRGCKGWTFMPSVSLCTLYSRIAQKDTVTLDVISGKPASKGN